MATKKAPTKDAKPSDMSTKDLTKAIAEKQQDLLAAKRSHAAGELVNPRALGEIRKSIARLKTALNAKKEAK